MIKKIAIYSFVLISSLFVGVSCSSDDNKGGDGGGDDNGGKKGTASATVAGTYIGAYDSNEFNKILLVEDLGDNRIRMSGNDRTPIEMNVQFVSEYTDHRDVMHQTGELAGVLVYSAASKTLKFSGKKIMENQKRIFFEGKKQ
ncbi:MULTISPECIES: hypothetical protein [unclassified Myroides]|uniref:hypothetical protein n=1 Tax=unclassified Myroides TaxID=2642485 RepID=UPI003D2F560F